MAAWDSDDLLAQFDLFGQRPATDESLTDAQKFTLLTRAQEKCYSLWAVHFPEMLVGDPTIMSTADSGETYTFASSVWPQGGVEIRASRTGELLVGGAEFAGYDYVWEGNKIRIPDGKTRTFAAGPYARYMTPPSEIDTGGADEPTLMPEHARILIVWWALYLWANRGGGTRDPNYWLGLFQSSWGGDPRIEGDVGKIGRAHV